ncbi:MAG: hypothetical protein IBX62_06785 [Coriobacteriia bacterium]|nr:hypothetical protein [Coriobacteriia bacterium]
MAQIDRMQGWIAENTGERVSRDELLGKARGSDLPQEVKRLMEEMPEGEWARDDLVGELRRVAQERFGAGVGADMGGELGGGGVFGE